MYCISAALINQLNNLTTKDKKNPTISDLISSNQFLRIYPECYFHPAFASTVGLLCVFSQTHQSVMCGTDSWKLLIEGRKSKQKRRERERGRKQARGRRAERRGLWIKAVEHYELLNHTRLTHTDWVCQLSRQLGAAVSTRGVTY